MPRVLLLLPTTTYRASDFLDAAAALGAEVVVASERRQAMSSLIGDRALTIGLRRPERAAEEIVALAKRTPLDAVLAVDDPGVHVAALAAERLGLRGNPAAAVARARNKAAMRETLHATDLPQPDFRVARPGADVAGLAAEVGYPCVVKPVSLSASRGVIRAEDPAAAAAAAARVRRIIAEAERGAEAPIQQAASKLMLVERYVGGHEVAVEGLLSGGELRVLAVFDKPDPLEGPYFEETIYVTPSRLPADALATVCDLTGRAAAALGLVEGPIHAELRLEGDRAWMLELAARSIGGLCSRSLRFGVGVSLEELILRHALGLSLDRPTRESSASGVMMIPIPREGVLRQVGGQDEARAVPGIAGLEISIAPGRPVRTLPEGDRYLGFLFARADTPEEVERALRTAHEHLEVVIAVSAEPAEDGQTQPATPGERLERAPAA